MPTIAQLQKQLTDLEYELEDGYATQRTYKQRVANIAREIEEKQKPKLYAPSPFKATVSEIADLAVRAEASTADLDSDMLTRIKKCLDRARHPNTPEAEAKAALTLANRLMRQYNVSQVEVLAHETPDKPRIEKGRSIVTIHPREGSKTTQVHEFYWLSALNSAMACLFNVRAITSTYVSREMVKINFCGIAENTVAAAYAFEMTFNLIGEWCRKFAERSSKLSYGMGICEELEDMARKAKRKEEARAEEARKQEMAARVEAEHAERQAQLNRLATKPEEPESLQATVEEETEPESDHAEDTTDKHAPFPRMARSDDYRTMLFEKILKRVATSIFENGKAHCVSLKEAVNEELEESLDRFRASEVNELLNQFIEDGIFEDDEDIHYVTLTPAAKRHFLPTETNLLDHGSNMGSQATTSNDATDDFEDDDFADSIHVSVNKSMPEPGRAHVPSSASSNRIADHSPSGNAAQHQDFSGTEKEGDEGAPGPDYHSMLVKVDIEAKKAADEYIEEHFGKLTRSRKRELKYFDEDAYAEGAEDAKKIDVHTKKIKA